VGQRQPIPNGEEEVRTILRRVAPLVAIAALGLFAATTVVAANPHTMYTCIKAKPNGGQDVQVNVPEPAVSGLTNAGFTCVPSEGDEEETTTGETTTGNEDTTPRDDQGGDDQEDEGPAYEEPGNGNPGVAVEAYVPQESRTLFCSTHGPAYRAHGEGMGIALNLPDSQGALMIQLGLVKPATFYQGIGATCDQLPGYKDSGLWVDHVGDVVPGVAVYPLFVTA
jgi:hypothetical protein